MKIVSRVHTFAVLIATATAMNACATERAVAPAQPAPSLAMAAPTNVPMLFVVDGIRLQRDQVPTLTGDQIASVHVIKGRAALREYGADASYGVVVIITKAAAARGS